MEGMTKLLAPNAAPDTQTWQEPTGDTALDMRLRDVLSPPVDMTYNHDDMYKIAVKMAPQLGVAPPESAGVDDMLKWHAMVSPVVEQKHFNKFIPALESLRRRVQGI